VVTPRNMAQPRNDSPFRLNRTCSGP
jgi:hypothetical protein